MHELSVAESALKIALHHAGEAGGGRITDLYLVIGEMASIVDDSIQFYWDIISEGTLAEGAQLHFHRIPIEMECLECGERYQPTRDEMACPACGGMHCKVVVGEEFYLESIAIEDVLQKEDSIGEDVNDETHTGSRKNTER